ncbi:MAG: hypothetical protein AAF317_01060 [Pseudomonadota bacterium]
MSDFYFEVGVLRDTMAAKLANDMEQTPYVLAEVAACIAPGSRDFDDFTDYVAGLSEEQKTALRLFCDAVSDMILEEDKSDD